MIFCEYILYTFIYDVITYILIDEYIQKAKTFQNQLHMVQLYARKCE